MDQTALSTIGALAPPLADITLPTVIGAAATLGVALLVALMLIKNFLHICQPNEVLIFTGRKRIKDGVDLGPMVVMPHGVVGQPAEFAGGGRGRKWRIPIIERVDSMDMRNLSIDIVVDNAYSAGNIPLRIHAIANVKIHSDPAKIRNAIERFLGRERREIYVVAQQTLEGAVREVVADMTPEQVNEDRLTFAEKLIESAVRDFDKLGLELDTLKIQNVSDSTNYLDSLGRPQIAKVLRDAENAENQAMQEITQAQALAKRRSEVAKAQAETAILQKRNKLTEVKASLDGEAQSVEREAVAAANTARAQAEQELQKIRAVLEQRRLQADVIIPAEARRQAESIRAKGEAAPVAENGRALIEVLEATTAAWNAMGDNAREIYVIQHLEEIIGTVIDNMDEIDIGEVSVLDRGDGSALAAYAAAYPQTVAAVLRALRETVGIDIPAVLAESDSPLGGGSPRGGGSGGSGGGGGGRIGAPATKPAIGASSLGGLKPPNLGASAGKELS
ncbi:flotillin family protein [Pseudenhygromyxa sp. WMMC2535]|uniref:flotillin family protein n=1 Tax=Pseudenhygromyxa sp. WMMC2535 TaxID=2712867 RepID=UPI001557EF94|nr:flotillin family protein [Pseudenhygromyxa sp. WMMC2535]NVB43177.1 flotillin family protein [Pseudenhygromyxa sp. WMMC2535]